MRSQNQVITFYSFKGGVGRTQAVANVGVELANRGYKVVLMDMDLESPGLHAFFGPDSARRWTRDELADQNGLLDYLDIARQLPENEPFVTTHLITCAHPALAPDAAPLQLLIPARFDLNYPQRVAQFSWDQLYQWEAGADLMEMVRRQLIDHADLVLIDSRTGMTDVAGICTFQLPDVVVALFVLHRQGIEGIQLVLETLRARRAEGREQMPGRVLAMPCRVDHDGPPAARIGWMDRARLHLQHADVDLLDEPDDLLPYSRNAAFGENVVVGDGSPLARAYERLAQRLVNGRQIENEAQTDNRPFQALLENEVRAIETVTASLTHRASRNRVPLDEAMEWATDLQRQHANGLSALAQLRRLVGELDVEPPTWSIPRDISDWTSTCITLRADLDEILKVHAAAARRVLHDALAEAAPDDDGVAGPGQDLERLLNEGHLLAWRDRVPGWVDEARRSSIRAMLRAGSLTVERLTVAKPDPTTRGQWLAQQLEDAINDAGDQADALLRLINLVALQVDGDGPTDTTWFAYETLLDHAAEPDAALRELGVRLWLRGWPLSADDTWRHAGRATRAQLDRLLHDSAEVGESLRAEVLRRWSEACLDERATRDLIRRRGPDPLLPLALAFKGTAAQLSAWMLQHGRTAASFAAWTSRLGQDHPTEAFLAVQCWALLHRTIPRQLAAAAASWMRHIQEQAVLGVALAGHPWAIHWLMVDLEGSRDFLRCLADDRLSSDVRKALLPTVLHGPAGTQLPDTIGTWLRDLERHGGVLPNPELVEAVHRVVTGHERLPAMQRRHGSEQVVADFKAHWELWLDETSADAGEPPSAEDWWEETERNLQRLSLSHAHTQEGTVKQILRTYNETLEAWWKLRRHGGKFHVAYGQTERGARDAYIKAIKDLAMPLSRDAEVQCPSSLWLPDDSHRTIDPALVANPTASDPAIYLEQLMAYLAGDRSWDHVLDEHMKVGDYSQAANAAQHSSPEAAVRFSATLNQKVAGLDDQLHKLHDRLRMCAGESQVDELVQEYREKLHSLDRSAEPFLKKSTNPRLGPTSPHLSDLSAIFRELGRLERDMSVIEGMVEDERLANDRILKDLRDRLLGDLPILLDDPVLAELTSAYLAAAQTAYQERSLERLNELRDAVELARDGHNDGLRKAIGGRSPAPPVPLTVTSPPRTSSEPPARRGHAGLATIIQAQAEKRTILPAVGLSFGEVSLGPWDAEALRQAAGHWLGVWRDDKDQSSSSRPLGAYVASEAKLALVEQRFDWSLLLFEQLFTWVCRAPDLDTSWRTLSAWGLTLSICCPFLEDDERKHVLSARNLAALIFHRPSTALADLDIPDAMWFIGQRLAEMEPTAARDYLKHTLIPALSKRPVASEALLLGLSAKPPSTHVLDLTCTFLDATEPDLASSIRKVTPSEGRPMLQELTRAVVDHIAEVDLARTLSQHWQDLREGLRSSPATGSGKLFHHLVSSKIRREIGAPITLEVVAQEGLFQARLEAVLEGPSQEQLPGGLLPSTIIGPLRAGERREVRIYLPPKVDPAAIHSIRLRYLSLNAAGAYAALATHAERLTLTTTPRPKFGAGNPYTAGKAAMGRNIFGRDEDIRRLVQMLVGPSQANIVIILGDRRIGKTTLLNKLIEDSDVRSHFALRTRYDMQDLPGDDHLFFQRIADRCIAPELDKWNIEIARVDLRRSQEDPYAAFKTYLEHVDQRLATKQQRMLILLDEMERLYGHIEAGQMTNNVIATLRSVAMSSTRIAFVLCGVTDVLRRNMSGEGARFYRSASEMELAPLGEDDALALVTEPVRDAFVVEKEAASYIVDVTGCQPELLQRVCEGLYLTISESGEPSATQTDVIAMLRRDMLHKDSFFDFLLVPWRGTRFGIDILTAIAHLQRDARYVSVRDITRRLRERGVEARRQDVQDLLNRMQADQRSLIDRAKNNHARFRLKVRLLGEHLRHATRIEHALVVSDSR